MQPTTASTIQPSALEPGQSVVYGALVSVILVLAGVIAVLWRRSERRYLRELATVKEDRDREVHAAAETLGRETKAAADALDREVKRTNDLASVLERQRAANGETLETIVDKFTIQADKARADYTSAVQSLYERKAAEDKTREGKASEMIESLKSVVSAAERRIVRRER